MDTSRFACSQILARRNPHDGAWEQEEPFHSHRYYFLDAKGVDDLGSNTLHRLLALHAPPSVVQNFLNHLSKELEENLAVHMTYDDDCGAGRVKASDDRVRSFLEQRNKSGATALHIAVYRNSWQIVPVLRMLIERAPLLASIPMECGSHPLHILAGHAATIYPEAWSVLLDADPSAATKEDCRGDTPLSLLWKNVLRFRWARSSRFEFKEIFLGPFYSWITIVTPAQYREFSIQLIRASICKMDISWHDICNTARCPPLFIHMLLQGDSRDISGSLLELDEYGRVPLHYAAAAKHVTATFVPDAVQVHLKSVVELLLHHAPDAASVCDSFGRLPLHYILTNTSAMSFPYWLRCVIRLVEAFPNALTIQDPLTKLYPAMQLAFLMEETEPEDGVGALYFLLRENPDCLNYHRGVSVP